MAAPNLPALYSGAVTTTVSSTAGDKWLDALYTSLTATSYDDARSIPAADQWQVTRYQNAGTTEAVYAEPASTSPVAGKVVFIWAYAAAGTHSSVAMASPDTYANGVVIFGAYVASAGQTVSRSNYNAWDNATPFSGGTGRFTGYTRLYAGTAWNKAVWFPSAEYGATQLETTVGTQYLYDCWGGFGIRAPTDSTTDSESGLGGRVFDFGTTGSTSGTGTGSTVWSNSSSSGWFCHGTTAAQPHWYYLVPGSSTIRTIGYKAATDAGPFPSATLAGKSISGATQPEPLVCYDRTGGGSASVNVGRHRFFFFGTQGTSRTYIANTAGKKKLIRFGSQITGSGDAAVIPVYDP